MKIVDMNYSQLLTALDEYAGPLTLYRQADKTWSCELFVNPETRHEAHGPTLCEGLRALLEAIRTAEMFAGQDCRTHVECWKKFDLQE